MIVQHQSSSLLVWTTSNIVALSPCHEAWPGKQHAQLTLNHVLHTLKEACDTSRELLFFLVPTIIKDTPVCLKLFDIF